MGPLSTSLWSETRESAFSLPLMQEHSYRLSRNLWRIPSVFFHASWACVRGPGAAAWLAHSTRAARPSAHLRPAGLLPPPFGRRPAAATGCQLGRGPSRLSHRLAVTAHSPSIRSGSHFTLNGSRAFSPCVTVDNWCVVIVFSAVWSVIFQSFLYF